DALPILSTSINIYFFARKSKINKHGEAPIYARITIDNERFELGTKRFVKIENWLADAGKVKGSTEAAKSINSFLNALKAKAFDHQRHFIHTWKRVSTVYIKNRCN